MTLQVSKPRRSARTLRTQKHALQRGSVLPTLRELPLLLQRRPRVQQQVRLQTKAALGIALLATHPRALSATGSIPFLPASRIGLIRATTFIFIE
jgi:hypothetical protein